MSTPAVEIRSYQVTIPAGTPEAAPYTQDIFFPAREVVAVSWRVPPGPSGLMGWRLTMNDGIAVIPYGGGWIIADDQYNTWPLTSLPDSGYWEVTGYNTGTYPHSVFLDFQLELISQAVSTPALISVPASPATVAPVTTTSGTTPVTTTSGTISPVTTTSGTTPGAISVPPPFTVPFATTPPAVSTPPVSTPPPVSVPPVSTPPPVSVAKPGPPPPVSIPPPVSVPPVVVKQPVFTDVVVPDVIGKRRTDAGPLIRAAGLTADFSAATGSVIRQRPAGGSLVKKGSRVYLVLRG